MPHDGTDTLVSHRGRRIRRRRCSWNMECGRIGLQMVVLRSRLFSDTLLEDDELLQK